MPSTSCARSVLVKYGYEPTCTFGIVTAVRLLLCLSFAYDTTRQSCGLLFIPFLCYSVVSCKLGVEQYAQGNASVIGWYARRRCCGWGTQMDKSYRSKRGHRLRCTASKCYQGAPFSSQTLDSGLGCCGFLWSKLIPTITITISQRVSSVPPVV